MRTGSPRNITVKGNHEEEYAWFKTSGSSPLISQEAEVAARNIIKALEYGESEAILSLSGKLATIVKGIAPGWVNIALGLANTFLPNPSGHTEEMKGYQVESKRSQGAVASLSDKAAIKNNEL
jgi:hypothetical protein